MTILRNASLTTSEFKNTLTNMGAVGLPDWFIQSLQRWVLGTAVGRKPITLSSSSRSSQTEPAAQAEAPAPSRSALRARALHACTYDGT